MIELQNIDTRNLPEAIALSLNELAVHYADFGENHDGRNGHLFSARNKVSNAEVAIKYYYGEPGDARHDEPRVLQEINSPNVINIYEARNVDDEWAFFITPWRQDGNLDRLISERCKLRRAITLTTNIALGLSELHQRNLVHRDLKPANIVLNNDVPEIADFGSVKLLPNAVGQTTASQHTLLYKPPEAFIDGTYTKQGDYYQLGCILYQLCGGKFPYDIMEHFNTKDAKAYRALDDDFHRSQFVDRVIERKCIKSKILDISSLPPYIPNAVRKCIRELTAISLDRRPSTIGSVNGCLSRALNSINGDWWHDQNGIIYRQKDNSRIVFSPVENNLYRVDQNKGNGFRRVPKTADEPLNQLLKRFI
ncbi:protein kinase [Thalassospira sp.]|uniref:protein kinase domain-containing protein n=1 Tax=Thalassospira sp. TaxID=1912094 RepID=UPI0032ECDCB5